MNRHLSTLERVWISVTAIALLIPCASIAAGTATWSGGSSGNWSDVGNWDTLPVNGDALVFNGSLNQINTNDTLTSVGAITFSSGGWTVSGDGVTLNGSITYNISGDQSWMLDTELAVTPTISGNNYDGTLTLSGVLSGNGGINKQIGSGGRGALVISGTNNSYTGASNLGTSLTQVTKLTDAGQNSSLGAPTGANATIIIGNGGTGYSATFSYIGSTDSTTDRPLKIYNWANPSSAYLQNNSPDNRNLSFTDTSDWYIGWRDYHGTLHLGGTSQGTNLIAAIISDSDRTAGKLNSIDASGNGTWILSGNNTYNGTTTVSGGELIINGTTTGTGAVSVASSTTLGGSGTLAGSVEVAASGTLAPGDPQTNSGIGTLNIEGNLVLGSNSTIKCPYGSAGASLVNIAGTATLPTQASILLVAQDNTPTPQLFTVLSASALAGETDLSAWTIAGADRPYIIQRQGTDVVAIPSTTSAAWRQWIGITFPGYTGEETLTNFPVLVTFNETTTPGIYDGHKGSEGSDLRFTDATGESELAYEIESWNPTGTSYVWVRVSQLTATSGIFMRWGKSSEADAPTYTTDGTTWAEGFNAVWHMNQINAEDSTANEYDGVATGNLTTNAAIIGTGVAMDGDGDFLNVATHGLTLTNDSTLSMWVNVHTNRRSSVSHGLAGATPNNWDDFLRLSGNASQSQITAEDVNGAGFSGPNSDYTPEQWLHLAVSITPAGQYLCYANGQYVGSMGTHNYINLGYIGAGYGGNDPGNGAFDGLMDEVRLTSTQRSADWIEAEWMNMASNAEFCNYGTVRIAPLGGTVIIIY